MQSETDELVIEAGRASSRYWRDFSRYRELFYFLAARDVLVRYKQTVIGIAWAIIRPLLTMIAFTVIFGKLAKMPSEGAPYPILVFAAMLPWQFFASALSDCSNSLVGNANLISKIYFPRLIIPASTVAVNLIDFALSAAILGALMIWYHCLPTWHLLALPVFILLAVATAVGSGVLFAALNVKYRDFRYVVPFVVQFGLYVSPVGFSSSVVPMRWRLIYSMNPMVGIIDGFRWSLIPNSPPIYWPGSLMSASVIVVLVTLGIWYFRSTERMFADLI